MAINGLISHNCRCIEIDRDRSGRSPKNEGILTGFMPTGLKMCPTPIEASISGFIFYTVDNVSRSELFLSPKGFL